MYIKKPLSLKKDGIKTQNLFPAITYICTLKGKGFSYRKFLNFISEPAAKGLNGLVL